MQRGLHGMDRRHQGLMTCMVLLEQCVLIERKGNDCILVYSSQSGVPSLSRMDCEHIMCEPLAQAAGHAGQDSYRRQGNKPSQPFASSVTHS